MIVIPASRGIMFELRFKLMQKLLRLFGFLTPPLRWFMVAMILANIAGDMVFSFLPLYLTRLGASAAQVGMAFTLAGIVPLVLQIFGGALSDSFGRLRTVALGSTIATLGYFLFIFAHSWVWVLIALCLEFVSGALVGPTYGAFVAEQSDELTRGRVFGLCNGFFMLVAIVGPPLGGALVEAYGFHTMLTVSFMLYTLATALRIWMAHQRHFEDVSCRSWPNMAQIGTNMRTLFGMLIAGGVVTWLFITDGARDIGFRMTENLEPIYLETIGQLSLFQIGQLRALLGLMMMVFTFFAGVLVDRYGERWVIVMGFLVQGLAYLVFLSAASFRDFGLSAALMGIGFGIMSPAYDALVTRLIPASMRGTAFGLFWSSQGVISLPAPWAGGWLWERLGPRAPFGLTAFIALLSAVPAWFKFHLRSDEQN